MAAGPRGVFYGYDFHLGPGGPQLIEIKTNAGGALLNLALARAQGACCPAVDDAAVAPLPLGDMEADLVAMFRAEWQLQRGDRPLGHVAIVDQGPAEQVMYPEFLMFQALFERAGLQARTLDPSDLTLSNGRLHAHGWPIDLVYNRLTDFYLQKPQHQPLADAFLAGAVVVTPHPRGHALYLDSCHMSVVPLGCHLGRRLAPRKSMPSSSSVSSPGWSAHTWPSVGARCQGNGNRPRSSLLATSSQPSRSHHSSRIWSALRLKKTKM